MFGDLDSTRLASLSASAELLVFSRAPRRYKKINEKVLAVVKQSQKFRPAADPLHWGRGTAKI